MSKETKKEFLTKDEELALGVKIQKYYQTLEFLEKNEISTKDKDYYDNILTEGKNAIDLMTSCNVRLVYDLARTYKAKTNVSMEYEDLVQEGMTGLMVAIQKYDPSMGNKFSTVAYNWISQAIARGANKYSRLIRLPENRINDLIKMNTLTQKFSLENKENMDEKIIEELNISKTDLINIRGAAYQPTSLNKVISNDSDSGKELIDFVSEENCSDGAEDSVMKKELNMILYQAVEQLSEIEKDVVIASFALDTESTPQSIKEKYGLQQHKFKKIQKDAMSQLKNILSVQGLNFSDFC